ncbi:MAG: glycogen/starch/alpha-glucan family phosphorylase [Candidatus Carbobacillus altaicus]|uniref:Alpha-1,4 glucan phosphorylase n=1 Tax=Candidatus Carbonibacillus altaicus TaxID=2163959 RepID=A0A2R6Y5E4_9BACL|nr:glycogen/starch/alpha-glucan family phosphorylase [Candidatus Carbobacillus altaicus]PTQ57894.1 MAG: Glycogen phosphorylase [Candidatus Carbobacillus altaicus]
MKKEVFAELYRERLLNMYAKPLEETSAYERYMVLATMVREKINGWWLREHTSGLREFHRRVYYLSAEFHLGRLLSLYIHYLGWETLVEEAFDLLGLDLEEILQAEREPGLGSGGLGRLAADMMDSLATLRYTAHGYGIRYRHGQFEQRIVDGFQVEVPDDWLRDGYPWEVRRKDRAVEVHFGGMVTMYERGGRLFFNYEHTEPVLAVPYYVPILGGSGMTNTLRLWSAESVYQPLSLEALRGADFQRMMQSERDAQMLSGTLYPDDSTEEGRRLRLKQQYFFVSASLQDILRRYLRYRDDVRRMHESVAIHINDTHPALAIPEWLRLLMDEEGLGWDEAWAVTRGTFSYTNHTILQEALETWPVGLIQSTLPRIWMIIEEIDRRERLKLTVRTDKTADETAGETAGLVAPIDLGKVSRMAIVERGVVRMAHLATVASHTVNGVSEIHSNLLKTRVLKDFYAADSARFVNVTNGISLRYWLEVTNPRLARLITEAIGDVWKRDPTALQKLHAYVEDASFRAAWAEVKKANKKTLSAHLAREGLSFDPSSRLDVQIKRIHGYKRQLLNILHVYTLYLKMKDGHVGDRVPRTYVFAGKAAPNYTLAKAIIKYIHCVAEKINADPEVRNYLQVLFLPNYDVTWAQRIAGAADVSEQIATASLEASGTGNMKMMLNGSLTIGTDDGANHEIFQAVGYDRAFVFGLSSEAVQRYYAQGGYDPHRLLGSNPYLKQAITHLLDGTFHESMMTLETIYHHLLTEGDPYFVLQDFASYVEAQERVAYTYVDEKRWWAWSIAQTAEAGRFSSDHTVKRYAQTIWQIQPLAGVDGEKRSDEA